MYIASAIRKEKIKKNWKKTIIFLIFSLFSCQIAICMWLWAIYIEWWWRWKKISKNCVSICLTPTYLCVFVNDKWWFQTFIYLLYKLGMNRKKKWMNCKCENETRTHKVISSKLWTKKKWNEWLNYERNERSCEHWKKINITHKHKHYYEFRIRRRHMMMMMRMMIGFKIQNIRQLDKKKCCLLFSSSSSSSIDHSWWSLQFFFVVVFFFFFDSVFFFLFVDIIITFIHQHTNIHAIFYV